MTDGGGGKAGDHDYDVGEGAKQVTLSSFGKRTATNKAGIYRAMDTTLRVGVGLGHRCLNHSTRISQAYSRLAKSRKR